MDSRHRHHHHHHNQSRDRSTYRLRSPAQRTTVGHLISHLARTTLGNSGLTSRPISREPSRLVVLSSRSRSRSRARPRGRSRTRRRRSSYDIARERRQYSASPVRERLTLFHTSSTDLPPSTMICPLLASFYRHPQSRQDLMTARTFVGHPPTDTRVDLNLAHAIASRVQTRLNDTSVWCDLYRRRGQTPASEDPYGYLTRTFHDLTVAYAQAENAQVDPSLVFVNIPENRTPDDDLFWERRAHELYAVLHRRGAPAPQISSSQSVYSL